MKKVIRDGKVAVLYSPGYGAGWYSWNQSHKECLFSPEIVGMIERGEAVTEEASNRIFGTDFYGGGACTLKIRWLPEGTVFKIDEYDGYESVTTLEHLELIA